jgi:hypothetical protein
VTNASAGTAAGIGNADASQMPAAKGSAIRTNGLLRVNFPVKFSNAQARRGTFAADKSVCGLRCPLEMPKAQSFFIPSASSEPQKKRLMIASAPCFQGTRWETPD